MSIASEDRHIHADEDAEQLEDQDYLAPLEDLAGVVFSETEPKESDELIEETAEEAASENQMIDLDEVGSTFSIQSLMDSMDVDEISRNLEIRYNQYLNESEQVLSPEEMDELPVIPEVEALPADEVDTEEVDMLHPEYDESVEDDLIELDLNEDLTLLVLILPEAIR